MSRIEKMIRDLCPDGVEHYRLGEVAGYSDTRIDSELLDEQCFVGVDNLLSGKRGKVDASYRPNTKKLCAFEVGDVLVANIRPYLKKIWLADRAGGCSGDVLAFRINRTFTADLEPQFLFYVLSSDRFFAYASQTSKRGKMPRGDKPALLRYMVPVPPLEVQWEIVRILDQFTELEAELETQLNAELEARRQQYEYYRQRMLGKVQAPRVALSALGTWRGGMTPSKSNRRFWDHGTIPWLASKDVSDETVTGIRGRVTQAALDETSLRVVPGPSVAVVFRSNILRRVLPVSLVSIDTAVNQDVKALEPREGVEAAYVYQAIRADRELIRSKCVRTDGSMAALSTSSFLAWEIPLPTVQVQRELAAQLGQFDALVNDLTSGLPAEIESRRKQYEYYRDQLLTFPERI